jgi:hypothetical protein
LPLARYEEAFELLAQGVAGKVVLLPQASQLLEPEPAADPVSTADSMVNEGGAA